MYSLSDEDLKKQIILLLEREFFLDKQAVLFDEKELGYLSAELRKEANIFKAMRQDLNDEIEIRKKLSFMNCEAI